MTAARQMKYHQHKELLQTRDSNQQVFSVATYLVDLTTHSILFTNVATDCKSTQLNSPHPSFLLCKHLLVLDLTEMGNRQTEAGFQQ